MRKISLYSFIVISYYYIEKTLKFDFKISNTPYENTRYKQFKYKKTVLPVRNDQK